MAAPKITDAEFIALWQDLKSAKKIATVLNQDQAGVHGRRRSIERRYHIKLESESPKARQFDHLQTAHNHKARHQLGIDE